MRSTEIVFSTKLLVNYTLSRFIAAKASDQPVSSPTVSHRTDPIRIILPFKDQALTDVVRVQLKDLIQKSSNKVFNYKSETTGCEPTVPYL